jgi:hypothetical protein
MKSKHAPSIKSDNDTPPGIAIKTESGNES